MSKAGPRETPTRLNAFVYEDLFGSGPVHMVDRFSRVSESGVEGDPRLASAEKGKQFSECSIKKLVEFCRLFRELKTAPDRDFNHHA